VRAVLAAAAAGDGSLEVAVQRLLDGLDETLRADPELATLLTG
jgi:hypothetical protein